MERKKVSNQSSDTSYEENMNNHIHILVFIYSCEFKNRKKLNLKTNLNLEMFKIGIHMMRKFRFIGHMKIKNIKKHSYELNKLDMKLIIVIM